MVKFFTPEEEAIIVNAIQAAETGTTGEIRVHLESDAKKDPLSESKALFRQLGMHQTKDRNGVLILLELNRQEFAIIGDEGIDARVGDDFWLAERDILQTYFRDHRFAEGLVVAIGQIGEKLKAFFPAGSGPNENELPNEISYG